MKNYMKNFVNKLLSTIKISTKNPWNGLSSTRISSYILLVIILLFTFVFLGIEVSSAIISLYNTGKYVISNESIIIFGSILSQQLLLLGINKNSEIKILNNESKKTTQEPVNPSVVDSTVSDTQIVDSVVNNSQPML